MSLTRCFIIPVNRLHEMALHLYTYICIFLYEKKRKKGRKKERAVCTHRQSYLSSATSSCMLFFPAMVISNPRTPAPTLGCRERGGGSMIYHDKAIVECYITSVLVTQGAIAPLHAPLVCAFLKRLLTSIFNI